LRTAAAAWFAKLRAYFDSPKYRIRIREAGIANPEPLLKALAACASELADLSTRADTTNSGRVKAQSAARACASLSERVKATVELDDNAVLWLEEDRDSVRVQARRIDVSEVLARALFDATSSVILVSATMTTGGTFKFLRDELGVPTDARELAVETPFDFRAQALLVVPDGFPEPNEPAFAEHAMRALGEVIERAGGRTLGLFTSYRSLHAAADALVGCRYKVYVQGDMGRTELIARFRAETDSVLLGVDSMWTGVDVPGESLSVVVIDRLPFPHPEDPLMDALGASGRSAFFKHMMPRAIMKFRQGVGRLIRTHGDRGVVVVLDPRIANREYGKQFVRSLPPMLSSRRLDAVSRFLGEVPDAAAS